MKWRKKDVELTERKKSPLVLAVAQFFLVMILFQYMLRFFFLVMPMEEPTLRQLIVCTFSMIVSLGMGVLTINAMLGLPSARPKAWRKVMRSAIIMLLVNVFYDVVSKMGYTIGMTVLSTLVVAIIVFAVVIIMCLPHVRAFYTPPMYQMPPLRNWLNFLLWEPLIGAESYKFTYGERPTDSHDLEDGLKTSRP